MAGATLEFDAVAALAVVNEAAAALADPKPMLRDIGEFLLIAHDRRFASQASPDGTPWLALSPRYLKRKRKNPDKILVLDGFLKNTLRYQVGDNELLFGTNRIYGAMMHFGGSIDIAARSQQAYFRQDGKSGEVGNLFVNKKRSNFSQWVTIGAYTIQIPARPWLGISDDDNYAIAGIAMRYLMPSGA
ncbi:phage virion morphogenesis protein [Pseudomonas aeruginosa]|uniref:phage virion morphogenesis protein n=1 Tax=Pseudomonas aeruginosa TaxID=287 RepID=UPI001E357913|nr:phage virion morphogenesis protein [Pseudomonas aeruginosa]MCD2761390.1 phage virion morphogenesis protein [Pseudomonas aeruginosa]HBP0991494.1 phage virion morphogenesis protein [Pseudomonas aeruginosa]HBP1202089.1 phage virion morphogenesis protein [Pseudomonas aeruginosa]